MKLENAKMDISMKNRQLEQIREMHSNTKDVDVLKEQIEEERSKFAQIMTNWAQEVSRQWSKAIIRPNV